jgi:hypothetical protein
MEQDWTGCLLQSGTSGVVRMQEDFRIAAVAAMIDALPCRKEKTPR